MSKLTPQVTTQVPILSTNPADAECFGVMQEFEPDQAEAEGAFREDALSLDDAWSSQGDGEGEGGDDGN